MRLSKIYNDKSVPIPQAFTTMNTKTDSTAMFSGTTSGLDAQTTLERE